MGTFETSKLLQKPQLSHSIYLFLNVSLSQHLSISSSLYVASIIFAIYCKDICELLNCFLLSNLISIFLY